MIISITALSHMKAVALVTSTMIAAGAGVPATHALLSAHTQRLSTEQMYRNYMQSGSIYYGPHSPGPPAHIVSVTKEPLLPAIEREAARFAGVQKLNPAS